MKTNTKFFISLALLILTVISILKKPDQLNFISEEMYANISLFVLIITAFFTGLYFEKRGKDEESPRLRASPPQQDYLPYSQQPFPSFEKQQQYPSYNLYPRVPSQVPSQPTQLPSQIQQLSEKRYTQPIDNFSKKELK